MAEKIIRVLLDDMEAEEVEADGGTIPFSIDGKSYEIDLSRKNATRLRSCMQEFIDHARPAGKAPSKTPAARKPGGPSGYSSDQLTAIRQWARRNGWPNLSDKGRVPAEVLQAFEDRAGKGDSEELFSALS